MQEAMYDTWFKFIRNIDEEDFGPETKSKLWSFVYETGSAIASAVFVIFLLFTFVFRAVGVVGESMLPTLSNGDWLLVSTASSNIDRGDVVVITQPNYTGKSLVKRVIALEGDVVNIDFYMGIVSVNGKTLKEEYILEPTAKEFDVEFPLTVPEGHVFVLGDNRNDSKDSRHPEIGLIDKREVLGKALFLFMPGVDEGQSKPEFDRIGVIK